MAPFGRDRPSRSRGCRRCFVFRQRHARERGKGSRWCDGLGFHTGDAQVAVAEFEPPSEVADKNERPFVTDWMVALGGVGQVYDQGVVQHGTVPFGHGFQSADELGQLFQALAADMGVTIGAGNTGEFLEITMADGMCPNVAVVPLQSQFTCHAGQADSIRSRPLQETQLPRWSGLRSCCRPRSRTGLPIVRIHRWDRFCFP